MLERKSNLRFFVGIDEVGRGALAGPVLVVAAALPLGWRLRKNSAPGVLRDSKKLSVQARERWFAYVRKEGKIIYAAARVSPRVIDRINISASANRAAHRAFGRLMKKAGLSQNRILVFLDGGLYLGNRDYQEKWFSGRAKTIIRGDEKINAVKVASIIAKVTRDRYMKNLSTRYPGYSFGEHKGYGTGKHKKALKLLGPTEIHRSTFI